MRTALAVMLMLIAAGVFAETNPALATVLSPDGSIMEGVSGSFDPAGFRMTYGPDGEPLFVEEESSPWESIPFPGGLDSEGTWYPLGSGVNSYNSWVNVIAVSGSDVYVGGSFTQAGGNPASRIAHWVPGSTEIEPPPGLTASTLLTSPNPMRIGTLLSFQSIGSSQLTLSIYDTAGRLVRTQALGTLPAGAHSHYWDGRDGNGSALASGVYFVRLSSTEQQASTRVVLVR